jgi:hypothetical protein
MSLDSPVNELSSKALSVPETMVASAGGVAPFCMRTMSPTSRRPTSIFSILKPGLVKRIPSPELVIPFSGSSLWE